MKKAILFSLILLVMLNACDARMVLGESGGDASPTSGLPRSSPQPSATLSPTASNTPAASATPVFTPSPTSPASATPPAPLPSPTQDWSMQGPGKVICPILLYHRIGTPQTDSQYYVTVQEFKAQLQALKDWGYTSIPASLLVEALRVGAKLPPRPVVITFDDGDASVYAQAYPLMREYGFSGVNYLVAHYVGTPGYMNVEQLKDLAAAGWEAGSHSMTHVDLTTSVHLEWEVVQSLRDLSTLLGLPVKTFAYPFGQMTPGIRGLVAKYYQAGMGLGVSFNQRREDLYYLPRRPVSLGLDVGTFGTYLPWNTPP